jgi:hypothetical protein
VAVAAACEDDDKPDDARDDGGPAAAAGTAAADTATAATTATPSINRLNQTLRITPLAKAAYGLTQIAARSLGNEHQRRQGASDSLEFGNEYQSYGNGYRYPPK